jgi:hypothetical protein
VLAPAGSICAAAPSAAARAAAVRVQSPRYLCRRAVAERCWLHLLRPRILSLPALHRVRMQHGGAAAVRRWSSLPSRPRRCWSSVVARLARSRRVAGASCRALGRHHGLRPVALEPVPRAVAGADDGATLLG